MAGSFNDAVHAAAGRNKRVFECCTARVLAVG